MSQIVRAGATIATGAFAVSGSATIIPLAPVLILAGIVAGTIVLVSALNNSKKREPEAKEIANVRTAKGDGTFYIQSLTGAYWSAELNSNFELTCKRKIAQEWEYFEIWKADNGKFAFQCSNKKYVSADQNMDGLLVANRDQIDERELFTLEEQANGFVAIKASNGKYVSRRQDNNEQLKATATTVQDSELFRFMIKQKPIAMKDPITLTETVVIQKTIEIKIDVLNHQEIVTNRKGRIWGTVINFASWLGHNGAKNAIKDGIKNKLDASLKTSIEKGIDTELSYRLCEEVSQKIVAELGANKIKANVIASLK